MKALKYSRIIVYRFTNKVKSKNESSIESNEERKSINKSTTINKSEKKENRRLMEKNIVENWKSISECLLYLKNEDQQNEIQDIDTKLFNLLKPIIDLYYKIDWFSHNIQYLKQDAQSWELKLSKDMLNVVNEIFKHWSNLNLYLNKTKLNITEVEKLDELNQILSKCWLDYYNLNKYPLLSLKIKLYWEYSLIILSYLDSILLIFLREQSSPN